MPISIPPQDPKSIACHKAHHEQRQRLAIDAKPFLFDFLIKLGKPALPSEIKRLNVGQTYNRIHIELCKQMKFQRHQSVTHHYWLWANGMPLDFLKTLTRKQAAAIRFGLDKAKTPANHENACNELVGAAK